MRKTRILAALLCVMMVITSLPMLTFAAALPTDLYSDIATVMNVTTVEPVENDPAYGGMNFDFTTFSENTSDMSTTDAVGTAVDFKTAGFSYDSTNGLNLPATTSYIWKYYPASFTGGWSPLTLGAYTLRYKLKNDSGLLELMSSAYNLASARSFVSITPTGVTVYTSKNDLAGEANNSFAVATKENDFASGTDWNDILILSNGGALNNGSGYSVYMKKATDASFTKIASTKGWRNNGNWKSTGMTIAGHDACVSNAVMLKESTGSSGDSDSGSTDDSTGYATIKDILGYEVKAVDGLDFQFANNFDSTMANVTTPTGATYDNTNGLDLTKNKVTAENSGASWRYKPSNGWGPLAVGSVAFQAKVNTGGLMNVQMYHNNSGTNTRFFMEIKETDVSFPATTGVTQEFDFVPGTDWAEYLVKKNDTSGFSVYVKAASTGDKWKLLATSTTFRSSGSNTVGLAFCGYYDGITTAVKGITDGGYIQYATVYEKDTSAGSGSGDNTGGGTTTPPAGTDDPYEGTQGNIKAVLGDDTVIIKNFQITSEFDTTQAGITSPAGADYSDTMGLNMKDGTWKYAAGASNYTPLSNKGFTFGAKIEAGTTLTVKAQSPHATNRRAFVDITQSGVTVYGYGENQPGLSVTEKLVDYKPGSEWNDYLLKPNENSGYDFYAKQEKAEDWTLVASTTSYRGNSGTGGAIDFTGSNGSGVYIKYVSVYGTEDELPEDEGPQPGEQYTMEEIIGGIAVVKEELVFDSSFNGVEEDAQLKNVTTGAVAATQPTIGESGLELKNTAGQYFAWGSGAENAWKPLTKSNPVMFRAKIESGGMLCVQMNGYPSASVYIYPDKLIAYGIDQKQAEEFAPGTDWVNYLVTSDGTNFRIYTKADGEEKWTVRVTSNGFRTGGYYGVLLDNTTTSKAYISEVKQYKIERMVLTDANTIASMTNKVFIDEDFSEDEGLYNMITGKIADGVFQKDTSQPENPTYEHSSRLDVDLGQWNPKGKWFVRFKYMIPSVEEKKNSNGDTITTGVSVDMQNNGAKIAIDAGSKSVFVINRSDTSTAKSDTNAAAGIGNWAELLFVWTDNSKVDIYWHLVGSDEWIKTHTNFKPGSIGMDDIRFHCAHGAQLDDVIVYSGDYVKIEEPELASGTVKTNGEFFSGTIDDLYDRRATLITAVYDATYGYTKFIKAKDYEVASGKGANLSNTFTTTGVEETKDKAVVMLWDTIDTGIPLGEVAGAATANTATGSPEDGAVPSVSVESNYNDVIVNAYTGIKKGKVTISIVDENGVLCGAGQTTANVNGLVTAKVAINPKCASGYYTVRVQYGTTAATEIPNVYLSCDDIPYNSITDAASMKSFINDYGSATAKKWNAEVDFAADVYARYVEAKGDTATFADFYAFRAVMDAAANGEVRERQMCLEVNTAAAAGKWSEVQTLLMTTYAEDLGLSTSDLTGISNEKELFLRITSDNTSVADIQTNVANAITAQKAAEAAGGGDTGGNTGGGGGGGGGGGAATGMFQGTTGFANAGGAAGGGLTPIEPAADFTDLDSVSWAEDSIVALRNMGVLSGDGDGTFAPNRAVTREEFLKMIMQAAGIQAKGNASVTFGDVDANEWYYPYVAAAYQNGIIQGMSETEFGIGQQITRADMAVMLKRTMDYLGITTEKLVASFVYEDFDTIPEYARESIDALSQAQLMNGKGNNTFEGNASATRAESAVAIYRIYNYIAERR